MVNETSARVNNNDQILVVDDEIGIRELLSEILSDEGYRVQLADSANSARLERERARPDLVLLDIWMPDTDGISLLKEWLSLGQLTMPVVMMSGHGSIETAVEATRIGAVDFLEKPISLPKLLATVARALQRSAKTFTPTLTLAQMGRSAVIQDLKKRLEQIAHRRLPLLLVGEKGAGTDLCARFLHQTNTPWIAPEEAQWLVENPFAPLAEARDGILFLADIAELTRAEQRGLGQLVGKLDKHNVRLVCASSRPPGNLIAQGKFDPELLSRVSTLTVSVPALREHAEDIPELATLMLRQMVESKEVAPRHWETAALNALRGFDWPGNLLSLQSAVKTLALTGAREEITGDDVARIASQFCAPPPQAVLMKELPLDLPLREARDAFEQAYFEHHIRLEGGNMSRVAEKVGLERTHLYRKLKQLGIRSGGRSEEV